jgi:hypothetical protein
LSIYAKMKDRRRALTPKAYKARQIGPIVKGRAVGNLVKRRFAVAFGV